MRYSRLVHATRLISPNFEDLSDNPVVTLAEKINEGLIHSIHYRGVGKVASPAEEMG